MTGDGRSRSNFVSGGHHKNYGQSLARVKRNLYDTSKQMSRYRQINKSGSLAHRLNRALPANTNFPESQLREKMTHTGLETAK